MTNSAEQRHDRRIQPIEQYARQVMDSIERLDFKLAHDFKHIDRVRRWALRIAQAEGYQRPEMVEAAALLHDIGLAYVEQRSQHALVGADIAAQFLQQQGGFSIQEIEAIADAIRCHSSVSGGGQLGNILRDADILDLLGAVGVMRACVSKYAKAEYDPQAIKGSTWGLTADDFSKRFREGLGVGAHIVDQLNFQLSCADNLQTFSAKQLAQPLIAFMMGYLLQLEHEINANGLNTVTTSDASEKTAPDQH